MKNIDLNEKEKTVKKKGRPKGSKYKAKIDPNQKISCTIVVR